MRFDPELLALLLIARTCELSHHSTVQIGEIWRVIVAMGPVDQVYLFTDLGYIPEPGQPALTFQAALDRLAQQRLTVMTEGHVLATPLGQDLLSATDMTAYEEALNQFVRAIPTLLSV